MNGVCIVALPVGNKNVTYVDGDVAPLHTTLVYFGDVTKISREEISAVQGTVFDLSLDTKLFPARVIGQGILGEQSDPVIFLESHEANDIRNALLGYDNILELLARFAQHPNWINHVTGLQNLLFDDYVIYDRLAVWYGDEKTTYNLVGVVTRMVSED